MINTEKEKLFGAKDINDYIYDPIIKNENGINFINIKFSFDFTNKIINTSFYDNNTKITDIESVKDLQQYIDVNNSFEMILKISHVLFNKDLNTYKVIINCTTIKIL